MVRAKPGAMLLCIGCDHSVARYEPGVMLAISCRCGGDSPILTVDGREIASAPVSLVQLRLLRDSLRGTEAPHLERYLGFSDHESPIKSQLEKELRALGCISMSECNEVRCQTGYGAAKLRAVY